MNKKFVLVVIATVIFVLVLLMTINLISSVKNVDTDNDGLLRQEELSIGTNPDLSDTDFDNIPDGDEYNYWMDRYDETGIEDYKPDGDIDGDGIKNILDEDSDNDGVTDGIEIQEGSDPTKTDTDGDGLTDFEEINGITDPANPDTDQDGIPDNEDLDPDGAQSLGDLTYGSDSPDSSSLWRFGGEPDVNCIAVFDPHLPLSSAAKRFTSYDGISRSEKSGRVDYNTHIIDSSPSDNRLYLSDGFGLDYEFTGIVTLDFSSYSPGEFIRIPSVSPAAEITDYTTNPVGIDFKFYRDDADNYYVSTSDSPSNDKVTLKFWTSTDMSYYSFYYSEDGLLVDYKNPDLSVITDVLTIDELKNEVPYNVKRILNYCPSNIPYEDVLDEINPSLKNEDNVKIILSELIDWFSSFQGDNDEHECSIPDESEISDTYKAMAMSQCGCCGVRSQVFYITANCIGIPTRLINNECHAYVEIYIPSNGWTMVQLGGCDPAFENSINPGYDPFDPSGSDETECSDGTCEGNEDCSNCPEDCGECIRTQTNITSVSSPIYKDEKFTVQGKVTIADNNQQGVYKMPVIVYMNETKNTIGYLSNTQVGYTNQNGVFSIQCEVPDNINPGGNTINAHSLGQDQYLGSWSDPPVNVYTDTYIEFTTPSSVGQGSVLKIEGILYDSSGSYDYLHDKNITISIDGSYYDTVKTEFGYFEKNFDTTGYNIGDTFTIKANFSGEPPYIQSCEKTMTVSVKDKSTSLSLTVKPTNAIRGEYITFDGILEGSSNDIPSGETININFNNQTHSAVTDNNGLFTKTIFIPLSTVLGEKTVEAKFPGSGTRYAESSNTTSITVQANATVIISSPLKKKFKANETVFINGTVLNDRGEPILDGTVNINWDLKTYSIKTDENGSFSVNYTILESDKIGETEIDIDFMGKGYYMPSSNSTTVEIINPESNVEESQNIYYLLLFSAITIIVILGVIMLFKKRKEEAAPSIQDIATNTINRLENEDDYRQAVINCYHQMCDWLGRQGVEKQEFQTPREFAMASKDYLRVPPETIYTLTQIFEKARYSKHEVNVDDKNQAIQCLNEIVSQPPLIENQAEIPGEYQDSAGTPGY